MCGQRFCREERPFFAKAHQGENGYGAGWLWGWIVNFGIGGNFSSRHALRTSSQRLDDGDMIFDISKMRMI